MSSRFLICSLALVTLTFPAHADEVECRQTVPDASVVAKYPEVVQKAQDSARLFCTSWLSAPTDEQRAATVRESLIELGTATRSVFDDNGWTFSQQLDGLDEAFGAFGTPAQRLPDLTTGSGGFGRSDFATFNVTLGGVPVPNVEMSTLCGGSCRAEVDELADVFNTYRTPYDDLYAESNQGLLQALNKDWDRFLEVSKSQTFLEVLLTTQFQQDHFKADHLVGPPPVQIIAVHPQVVYEASTSVDDEFDLAVEWIGFNLWNRKIPLGASLTTVYTKINGERESRHGVMLHIHNKYSIGWAKGDDDSGVFVTIDLLKMVEDKKAQINRYTRNL